jgi:3-isopropylmalate/(R)-2-methylmalate dehydratase small subunit
LRNGLLPVVLPTALVGQLARKAEVSPREWRVSLQDCIITDPAGAHHLFEFDSGEREQLLRGLDPIDVTMERIDAIWAFTDADRLRRPWIWVDPEGRHRGP